MTTVTAITAIIGAAGLIVSLLLVALQLRELSRQTRLNNSIGAAAATHSTLARLHEVQMRLLDHPELYPYFYENKKPPESDRAKASIVAEILADVVDYGLVVNDILPSVRAYEGWSNYSVFLLDRSPILRELVHSHPEWCAQLDRELHKQGYTIRKDSETARTDGDL